jgi:hypothetical protein
MRPQSVSCRATFYGAVRMLAAKMTALQVDVEKSKGRGNVPTHFSGEPIYVATSQFEGCQHDCRKAQRFETFRTRRAAQEARPMEGRQQGCRSPENETGCVSKVDLLKKLQS